MGRGVDIPIFDPCRLGDERVDHRPEESRHVGGCYPFVQLPFIGHEKGVLYEWDISSRQENVCRQSKTRGKLGVYVYVVFIKKQLTLTALHALLNSCAWSICGLGGGWVFVRKNLEK